MRSGLSFRLQRLRAGRSGCGAGPGERDTGRPAAQWLAMLLLSSLLLLLLLGAPLGCAEDAAAALSLERILEWQGECPRGRRDQISTSGTGVAKGEEKGRSWGRARAARAIGFRWWPRLCSPEKALWMGQSCTRTGLAPFSPSPAPPRSRRYPPVFSCGHERRGLGLQATGLNSGRAQA